ncbi:MAG: methyltransferase domain-containing protein [Bacteroidetes bacterium]|nr:MAG: methyltransferase domain-containing protein [Bacteroidota bacterium]
MKSIYNPDYIEDLFDKMSASYARMNYITSFGFSTRWRRQCVQSINIPAGATVADLMTGMGECWSDILNETGKGGRIIALDFSEGMLQHAYKRLTKMQNARIDILKANVFDNEIPDQSVDAVISGFGIKTFSESQLTDLANEIHRILKPGGSFSLIDVSVPTPGLLRRLYMFYLKNIIPILGWLFLGNPETYKMLGIYTEHFQNSEKATEIFRKEGFEVEMTRFFYGCATGIKGKRQG